MSWISNERPSVFRAKFQNLLLFPAAGMKTSQWKRMRVLIADDQKSVGTSLAEMVGLCHHQVVEVVATGMEAIQAYDRHRPDVVLMDYRMPKLNGITACRYILAKDPNARVILISGVRRSSPSYPVQSQFSPNPLLCLCSMPRLPPRSSPERKKSHRR